MLWLPVMITLHHLIMIDHIQSWFNHDYIVPSDHDQSCSDHDQSCLYCTIWSWSIMFWSWSIMITLYHLIMIDHVPNSQEWSWSIMIKSWSNVQVPDHNRSWSCDVSFNDHYQNMIDHVQVHGQNIINYNHWLWSDHVSVIIYYDLTMNY